MKNCNPKRDELPKLHAAIEEAAGYSFRERGRLETALTHSSYAAEQPQPTPWNERLEFLGDSVLQLAVTRMLYVEFPEWDEGRLTRARSVLVDEKANAGYAHRLGLVDALLLGHGENQTGGRERPSILGDLFEAFLGAVYLDGGLAPAEAVVRRLIPDLEAALAAAAPTENPKGALQNYSQQHYHCPPEYVQLESTGPVHAPRFVCEVRVNGETLGRGEGSSKKAAEQAAAAAAMAELNRREAEA